MLSSYGRRSLPVCGAGTLNKDVLAGIRVFLSFAEEDSCFWKQDEAWYLTTKRAVEAIPLRSSASFEVFVADGNDMEMEERYG